MGRQDQKSGVVGTPPERHDEWPYAINRPLLVVSITLPVCGGLGSWGMALTAVVTGASGYLAGEVIHQLLAKGYNVRGTVTNVEDRRKTGPLLALRRALPGKLTLTEADLFEPGSFDDVVRGADFVFHTASNVIFDSSNPEASSHQHIHCQNDITIATRFFQITSQSPSNALIEHAKVH